MSCSAPGRLGTRSPLAWRDSIYRCAWSHDTDRRGSPTRVDWRAADASDPEAATEAASGASVIYQCLNAPYTDWPRSFPPLQRGVLAAAERTVRCW